mmetsp:Transcript_21521/g.44879  ORF Transcript_21521/g.44879 Transcript_21521/m.44879 type:complete len:255 (+) Transcript_21521:767-1531(+)
MFPPSMSFLAAWTLGIDSKGTNTATSLMSFGMYALFFTLSADLRSSDIQVGHTSLLRRLAISAMFVQKVLRTERSSSVVSFGISSESRVVGKRKERCEISHSVKRTRAPKLRICFGRLPFLSAVLSCLRISCSMTELITDMRKHIVRAAFEDLFFGSGGEYTSSVPGSLKPFLPLRKVKMQTIINLMSKASLMPPPESRTLKDSKSSERGDSEGGGAGDFRRRFPWNWIIFIKNEFLSLEVEVDDFSAFICLLS